MRTFMSCLLLAALGLFTYNSISGQTSPEQRQDEPALRLKANEVSLDIVVKDKKGRSVKDLKAADFEIYEDGVLQKVESFRFVLRESAAERDTVRKEGKEEPAPQPAAPRNNTSMGVIALVFDRLSPEAR